ncbi:MAG: ferredoxin [Candidatus Berkelbacteria bacterium]|nr:ferredoxin [Candidatus Berkelbacteria bacterium]
MAKYKIIQDHDACIGCGTCVSLCSKNWEMGEDGKAHPKETEISDIGCNQEAQENCPVQCIKVEETK